MKIITTLIISLILSTNCIAQTRAISDLGEEVILFEDGSWKYDSDYKQTKEYIYESKRKFTKSVKSTFLLKSKVTSVGIWLNPKKWGFTKSENNPDAEYEFELKGQDAYGMLITERIEIPLKNLKNLALENAKSVAPDIHIVKEEYRSVNNIKILMMQMDGTLEGISIRYYGYYFSNSNGTAQLLTYTSQNLFEIYKNDINDLLNGMVELE